MYSIRIRLSKSAVSALAKSIIDLGHEVVRKAAVPFAGGRTRDDAGKWDGSAAAKRIAKWASSDGSGDPDTISWAKYRKGFAVYEPDADETLGGYSFPHHDIDEEGMFVHRGGMLASGNAAMGARAGSPNTEAQKHLTGHYKQFDMMVPWEED